jgi:hypothetical protein
MKKNNAVSIVTGYDLDAQCFDFPLGHHIHSSSEVRPFSHTMHSEGSFPGDKAARVWLIIMIIIITPWL